MSSELDYIECANRVSGARVKFAREFQLARAKVGSDKHAEQIAIEITGDELTVLYAELEVAKKRMNYDA